MTESSNIIPFPQSESEPWITEYQASCLSKRNAATIDAYVRILQQFTEWVVKLPGHSKQFEPVQLTNTVVEAYLVRLEEQGYSVSHRTRVKSVIKHFLTEGDKFLVSHLSPLEDQGGYAIASNYGRKLYFHDPCYY